MVATRKLWVLNVETNKQPLSIKIVFASEEDEHSGHSAEKHTLECGDALEVVADEGRQIVELIALYNEEAFSIPMYAFEKSVRMHAVIAGTEVRFGILQKPPPKKMHPVSRVRKIKVVNKSPKLNVLVKVILGKQGQENMDIPELDSDSDGDEELKMRVIQFNQMIERRTFTKLLKPKDVEEFGVDPNEKANKDKDNNDKDNNDKDNNDKDNNDKDNNDKDNNDKDNNQATSSTADQGNPSDNNASPSDQSPPPAPNSTDNNDADGANNPDAKDMDDKDLWIQDVLVVREGDEERAQELTKSQGGLVPLPMEGDELPQRILFVKATRNRVGFRVAKKEDEKDKKSEFCVIL